MDLCGVIGEIQRGPMHSLSLSFGSIKRKWGVSDPLENTSGQRWCLPRVKILGAVPLEEIFLLADSTLLGNRARTLHLQTYLSHAYVNMSPSFLSSLPNSYPRRFLFSFQDNFIISILDILGQVFFNYSKLQFSNYFFIYI